MEMLQQFLDVVLHLNTHLDQLATDYGPWIYGILFLIVFCETGLVITPFLPGDSLLFAAGAIAAGGKIHPGWLGLVLVAAALLGDNVNYWVGRFAGRQLVRKFPRLVRQRHLDKTHSFFDRYGGKTIVIARFVPIVRTFTPFVAGVGRMPYPRFMAFSLGGALLWVGLLVPAGYFFANVPIVKRNFSAVILMVIFLSLLPAVVEILRERKRRRQEAAPPR